MVWIEGVAFAFAVTAVFIGLIVAGWWLITEVPNIPTNRRIIRRLAELKASGFAPSHQYIHAGAGVAVDGVAKQIFLANAKLMKVYSIADVTKVESDFNYNAVIRFTVRDLNNPLFRVRSFPFDMERLREIDSLVSIIREPTSDQRGAAAAL